MGGFEQELIIIQRPFKNSCQFLRVMVKVTTMASCYSFLRFTVLVTVAVTWAQCHLYTEPIKPYFISERLQGLPVKRVDSLNSRLKSGESIVYTPYDSEGGIRYGRSGDSEKGEIEQSYGSWQRSEGLKDSEAYDGKATVSDTVASWSSSLLPSRWYQRIKSSMPFSVVKTGKNKNQAPPVNVKGQEKSELESIDGEMPTSPENHARPGQTKPKRPFFQLTQFLRFARPSLRMPSLLTGVLSDKQSTQTLQTSQPPAETSAETTTPATGEKDEDEADDEDEEEDDDEEDDDANANGNEAGDSDDDNEAEESAPENETQDNDDAETEDSDNADNSEDNPEEAEEYQPAEHQFRNDNPTHEKVSNLPDVTELDMNKAKKKLKFKQKIYSILYKTMDVLDKSFSEPDDDE